MHVLVTAGPTHEFIDDVRYIASPSSGRMGFAAAEVFAERGHSVTLVTGPTHLDVPAGVTCVRVVSALDMQHEVMQRLDAADAVVMTAAVADYRAGERTRGKRKRSGDKWLLELVENPDILEGIGAQKGGRILVGFAVESSEPRKGALDKLRRKNLDFIVLNSPAAFGAEKTSVDIISRDETTLSLRDVTKREVAEQILKLVEGERGGR